MSGVRVFDMESTNLPLINSLEELSRPGVSMGICLSTVLMWARETMVQGDMSNDEVLRSNRQVITMRQASFQFDSRVHHCEYLDLDKSVIENLLSQYKLRIIQEGEGDLLDFVGLAGHLQTMPGYYLFYFKNPEGDRGHAIGFKFASDGRSFLFDPADGLFRFRDNPSLIITLLSLNSIGYEAYMGGQYWYKRLALG